MDWYKVIVNPEPWALGPVGTGRRGGKIWAYVGRNQQLYMYQQAVKEELAGSSWYEGELHLLFLFWRCTSVTDHAADTTNLQKGTEDALQGVLFENDRVVIHSESIIMAQGPDVEGKVLFGIEKAKHTSQLIPLEALALLATIPTGEPTPGDNSYDNSAGEIF